MLRLDFLIIIVIAAGCSACILLRNNSNPIYLSLMLQYLLTLQNWMKASMSTFGNLE